MKDKFEVSTINRIKFIDPVEGGHARFTPDYPNILVEFIGTPEELKEFAATWPTGDIDDLIERWKEKGIWGKVK